MVRVGTVASGTVNAVRRGVVAGCVAVVAITGLAACVTAPDRQAEADRLETEIRAMPGVQWLSVNYTNEFSYGSRLDLDVGMTTASEDQIGAVVARIDELTGPDFDGYQRTTEFTVAEFATIGRGAELWADSIIDDTRRVRRFRELLPVGRLEWPRHPATPASSLTVFDVESADAAIVAARTAFGDLLVTAHFRPGHIEQRDWQVTFPFTVDQESIVRQRLSELPVTSGSIAVSGDTVTRLSVDATHPPTAEAHLEQVIAILRPPKESHLLLSWGDHSGGLDPGELRFAGVVDVGGCGYRHDRGAREQEPGRFYTPEAIELQRKLRAKYDTCAR